MTSDHLAVTPYYDGPQSVEAQIASLGDLHYSQKNLAGPDVILLGLQAALRTFTAEFVGTFKGKEIPRRQFVTSVMVKRRPLVGKILSNDDARAVSRSVFGSAVSWPSRCSA